MKGNAFVAVPVLRFANFYTCKDVRLACGLLWQSTQLVASASIVIAA
jgi:hypothetical protein